MPWINRAQRRNRHPSYVAGSDGVARGHGRGVACVVLSVVSALVVGCPMNGGIGNGNDNDNLNANENANVNVNANENANVNVNASSDDNANGTGNENTYDNENENNNENENENENANANENGNANQNGNDNGDDGDNENENENANGSDDDGAFEGVSPDSQTRLPFASQCAQFAGLCTSSFPSARLTVVAGDGQMVTETTDPVGFIVEGSDGDGGEVVQLRGSDSLLDNAVPHVATELTFSWSTGATDEDPCTFAPGPEFSTEADPQVALQAGVHYVRLTVHNDVPLDQETLPQSVIDRCGGLDESFKFDVVEVVVEVRD